MKTVLLRATLALSLVFQTTILAAQTTAQRAEAEVRYLASDALQGRGVGTPGIDSAAQYIARQFRAIGLTAPGNSYFQSFELDPSAPALAHAGIGHVRVENVVGVLPGRGVLASEAVVLGAHYDHLGLGGFGSMDPDSTGLVHNGADDNASGTAAVIEAARILAARPAADRRTFVFVAFTGEELGLLGSDYYTKHPVFPNDSTYAMINFDMVGRLRGDSVEVIGANSARELEGLVRFVNTKYAFQLSLIGDPWGRSDHSSFYAARIPVVHLFTNTHEDYHRTTDDWQKINPEGIAKVARFASDLAWELATRRPALAFVDVPAPVPSSSGGYGAYLGTIPDMSKSPGGVRLTGVRSASPAEQGGIQAGDVIVKIGSHDVSDLYGMTDALRAYKAGDTVIIAYLRDGTRREVQVTLGKRGG